VYDTIQSQISSQLAQLRTQDITARRSQLMEDYIRTSNQKRYGLYRDIIIESEYDPHLAHATLLKYQMSDKDDPLKAELNQIEEGMRTKQKRPLGRATLPTEMWSNLTSTPYGRFDRILPPPEPMNPGEPIQFSRVPFDHYNIPTGSEILNRELPRGKRIQCDGQQRDQRMSSIFD